MSTSPFPGMDPYLEDPENWRGFHQLLASEMVSRLNSELDPKYYADLDVRTVLQQVGIATSPRIYPDIALVNVLPDFSNPSAVATKVKAPIKRKILFPERMRTRTVHIFLAENKELVTVIEILSPANKTGTGLQEYRFKRDQLVRSAVHLVEIDLLRGGHRPGPELRTSPLDTDYVLLVSRAEQSDERLSEIWPLALNEPLMPLPIPLLEPDPDIILDLGEIMATVYEKGAYSRRIDYQQPIPAPRLRPAMQAWLEHNPLSSSS